MVDGSGETLTGVRGRRSDTPSPSGDEATVEADGGTPAGPGPTSIRSLRRGTAIGRYLVLERLGAGAMGAVFLAYDPELDRRIAIKLLQRGDDEAANERLLREAQALARLSDPHVVAVHDVGEHEGQVFIAMEFVRGQTLRAWAADAGETRPRPYREVLEVFCAAGLGLAAAHDKGIVHRDFKPDNVMLGDDGRVRVMDFGLAGNLDASERSMVAESIVTDSRTPSVDLTGTGALLGTPAYMSPEQFAGTAATAKSDQFSFCVALYEALYGRRPFAGETLGTLARAVLEGEPAEPLTRVPRRVRLAVRRGLAKDPSERHASVAALVGELRRDPMRRRTRDVGLGLGVLAVGIGAAAFAQRTTPVDERCTGSATEVAKAWGPDQRAQAQAAFAAVELPFAALGWDRVSARADEYAREWSRIHRETCEATEIRAERSADTMDRQMACLDRARHSLSAVSGVLASADASVVRNADRIVRELPDLTRCEDLEWLSRSAIDPGPGEAATVSQAREWIAAANAETAAARLDAAGEAVAQAEQIAAAVAFPPLDAELALAQGRLAYAQGDYERAEVRYRDVIRLATAAGHEAMLTVATTRLMHLVGSVQRRPQEALMMRDWAEGLAQRNPKRHVSVQTSIAYVLLTQGDPAQSARILRELLASPDPMDSRPRDRAALHNGLANALRAQGKLVEAVGEYEAAFSMWSAEAGVDHPRTVGVRRNLATTLSSLGRFEEAERHARGALDSQIATGAHGRFVAEARHSLALVLEHQAKVEEALTLYQQAHRFFVDVAPDRRSAAIVGNNLAGVLRLVGRLEKAEALARECIAAFDELMPGQKASVTARFQLSLMLTQANKHGEALAVVEEALEVARASLPPEDLLVGRLHNRAGAELWHLGRLADAEAAYRRALVILDDPDLEAEDLWRAHLGLAEVLAEQGRFEDAGLRIARAREGLEASRAPEHDRAQVDFVAASMDWLRDDTPAARREAHDRVAQALRRAEADPSHFPINLENIQAWLQAHPRP